jgi:hypothetical protein
MGRSVARDLRSGIAALIVNQDHAQFARIILTQQRSHGFAHARGLIARRNNYCNRGPRSVLRRHTLRRSIVVALSRQPESPASRQEIQPDRKHH